MEDLFAVDLSDPMAIQLSRFFNTQCSNEMLLARELATIIGSEEPIRRNDYEAVREQYCRLYSHPDKKITNTSLEEYVMTLKPAQVKPPKEPFPTK